MIKIFIITYLTIFQLVLLSQPERFFQPENRVKFGNYLFKSKDYLRAIDEYRNYLKFKPNDTLFFKIGIGYERLENYDFAQMYFSSYPEKNIFSSEAKLELFKIIFLTGNFDELRVKYSTVKKNFKYFPQITRLNYITYFFEELPLPDSTNYRLWFAGSAQDQIMKYYSLKLNLPRKSLTTAGVLSALIPGLGKIYTGNIGDGITALIVNGLLGFLSYDNFKAGHNFRGWLFAGLTAFFYGGNIYGSVAAAQIFNKQVKTDYEKDILKFLERENYFLPEYEFLTE